MDHAQTDSGNAIRDRIVTGNIWTTVLWLSWPSVITMVLQNAYIIIDGVFLGRLSSSALAGVGVANQVMMVLSAVGNAISIGITAIVARLIGAGDRQGAELAVRQSLLLTIAVSAVTGGCGLLAGYRMLGMIVHDKEALRQGTLYMNMLLIGIAPNFLMLSLTGVYRGLGDMITPLVNMGIMTVLSIVGDYALIFGIGPVPAMGVTGAGTAFLISRSVAMLVFFFWLPRTNVKGALRGSWRPHWDSWKRILNIGTPAFFQSTLRSLGSSVYYGMLGGTAQGVSALAALTIGLRSEGLAFMPGFGFSVAATSMVGQNLGAGRPDRAEKGAWAATYLGMIVMGAVGVVFIVFARPLAGMFTQDPHVLPLAAAYLLLNGITEPFLAMSMVLTGALQGAGETRLPTAITIFIMWIVRIPLTYYLAIHLGLQSWGAWAAMSSSSLLGGLAMLVVFKRSRWKEKEI